MASSNQDISNAASPFPPTLLSDLGPALVRLRQDKGILQKELAQRIGVLPQSLNRMEQSQYRGVSVERLVEVAEALGIQLLVFGAVPLAGSEKPESTRL
jgi:transcriptional regulator with XRE-family HTH domain